MAQFAPVAPIQILEGLQEEMALGKYHLLLAHHVLEHPDRFRELFANEKGCTIIMDNSIVELGASQNEAAVLEACKIIQPETRGFNYVIPVLTDVMGNGEKTRVQGAASYSWWMDNAPEYNLMVVLQGGPSLVYESAWDDFVATVDFFLLDPAFANIGYAGIPRKLVEFLGTRKRAIEYVDAVRPDIAVHLLGFSNDVSDDVICAQHASVEGIDSAVPLRYSYAVPHGRYTPSVDIPPRSPDWFEKGTLDQESIDALYNIRKWVA